MNEVCFTVAKGARPKSEGRPRVAIVVTDGQSAVPEATVVSAKKAHNADITMYAVGIGDVDTKVINIMLVIRIQIIIYLHIT